VRKFDTLVSSATRLDRDDIDTDQIIPARFLRTTERTGLGEHLFEDWRCESDGTPKPEFVLNQPGAQDAHILIGGRNFGCGSSREHAVWSLMDFGIAVVIAQSFADIFRKNSLRNGLLPISVDAENHVACLKAIESGAAFTVDLEAKSVGADGVSFGFDVDPFARTCLLEGVDDLEYILRHVDQIARFEKQQA
jgi:3-isopropylmalate/(R)-2-methylmalate dehydratase small subunit